SWTRRRPATSAAATASASRTQLLDGPARFAHDEVIGWFGDWVVRWWGGWTVPERLRHRTTVQPPHHLTTPPPHLPGDHHGRNELSPPRQPPPASPAPPRPFPHP